MHVACTTMHFDPFRTGLHEGFIRRQGGLLEYIVEHLQEDYACQLEHLDNENVLTLSRVNPGLAMTIARNVWNGKCLKIAAYTAAKNFSMACGVVDSEYGGLS
jgi:hypothetical protein